MADRVVAGVWWLVRNVLGPAVLVAFVLACRWLSGANLSGRPRVATFRRAAPSARPVPWWRLLGRWALLPGYQRLLVRWALTGLVVAGWVYPLAPAAAVATAGLAAGAWAVWRVRTRIRARVRALLARPRPAATIAAGPALRPGWWLDGLSGAIEDAPPVGEVRRG